MYYKLNALVRTNTIILIVTGSETYKGAKSGAKFSRQKSVTATPLMEEDEPVETESSSQKSRLNAIIGKLKELIIQVSHNILFFYRRQKEEIWKGLNLSNLKDHYGNLRKCFKT